MTVSIMILMLTVGAINYLRFLDKQKVYQSGSNIEAMLKDARSKAQNGFLGDSEIGFCTKLEAIEVSVVNTTENKILSTAKLHCVDDSLLTYDSYLVPESGTTINKNFIVSFLPMRGAIVSLAGSVVSSGSATINRSNVNVTFNFDQGGIIDVKYE